jgi:two-component system chemotaxis sensor kinase CheA
MKISFKIILINFAIVVLILGGSGAAFYSIMFNVLTSQQSKRLLRSSNDFLFSLQQTVQETDETFGFIVRNKRENFFDPSILNNRNLDFIYKVTNDSLIYPQNIIYKKNTLNFSNEVTSISEFLSNNPFTIIKSYKSSNNEVYYYGLVLSKDLINNLSKRIDADIAVFIDDTFSEYSNPEVNQKFFYSLNKAYDNLKLKGNFDIYSEAAETYYFLATMYRIKDYSPAGKKIAAVIFSTSNDTANLWSNIRDILTILSVSSVFLSLILSLLFTSKIRKQIAMLNDATEITKTGNFNNRLTVKSKDELGNLATAFNKMLDELEKKERTQNEYAEFITLINQNPTLRDISDAALKNIINTTNLNVGTIYLVEDEKISLVTSYGVKGELIQSKSNIDLYSLAIKKAETIEVKFDENLPHISTGIFDITIKYLLILPIAYNGKVIAIVELGSVNLPKPEVKEYLERIKEQLAIGIVNATALMKLENLVIELKKLNEEYQKQNIQITQQNETLVELHKQLQEKAQELEIQKEKAEESAVLKSQFLALMSHELKTPLNSILGLTELILEDHALNPKNKERLAVVLKSGKRLMSLINDILIYSRIEAGKIEVKSENFSVDELLDEIKSSFSTLTLEKGLYFNIQNKLSPNTYVFLDRTKVLQVLTNLLDNAIKFTDKGFVKILVESEENKKLIFSVSDSGKGISKAEQEIIFEEFRQVDSSTSRKYTGSGLGLSICKKFVELMNGSILVQSEVEKGTKFTVVIPTLFFSSEETGTLTQSVEREKFHKETSQVSTVSFNNLEDTDDILIVDDNTENLFTMNEIVQKANYKTMIAKNGQECLEILEKKKPALILLDIMMPVMDGFQTILRIKEKKELTDIPVLAVSAKAMSEDSDIIFKYGFEGFIPKPINANFLIEQIAEIISKHKRSYETNFNS